MLVEKPRDFEHVVHDDMPVLIRSCLQDRLYIYVYIEAGIDAAATAQCSAHHRVLDNFILPHT